MSYLYFQFGIDILSYEITGSLGKQDFQKNPLQTKN